MVAVEDLSAADVGAFLQAHVDDMHAISPPDSCHVLDLDGLRRPDVTFWTVRDGGTLVACGALRDLGDGHGEVKSMRTAPERTGEGLATLVLGTLVDEARRRGMQRLSLETGTQAPFAPAHRLYARHGFVDCAPFGGYRPDPCSRFMTRPL